jgi:hypothetical protein
MALEHKASQPEKRRTPALHAAIIGGMIGSAVTGVKSAYEKSQINSHLLTPSAISELRKNAGVSDQELSKLEVRTREFLIQELDRLRKRD